MSSDKNIYLAALVVLALGIGNSQIRKHMDWVGCLSSRLDCVASRVSDRALDEENRFENLAERAFSRGETRFGRGQTALARVQVRLACAQARMAERQAEMVRAQSEKVRVVTCNQVRHTMVIERQNAMRNALHRMKVSGANRDMAADDDKI
jgi:hypothetical protein